MVGFISFKLAKFEVGGVIAVSSLSDGEKILYFYGGNNEG